MSKAKIFLFFAFLLITGLAILLVVISPRERISSRKTQAEKVSLNGYDERGDLIWSLEALEGEMKDETGTLTLVKVLFYEQGTTRLQATADTLTFAGNEATLDSEVEISSDDYRLHTERLTWFESKRMLTAGDVTIFFEKGKLKADAFQYNLNNEQAILEGKIIATFNHTSGLHVIGDRAELTDDRLILTGEVAIERQDETYRCAILEYSLEEEKAGLAGGVEGSFRAGTIHADSVTLTTAGIAALGKVNLTLDPQFFNKAAHGT